jgi:peptidoglycan hydrolase-like protein with peptidoglycan-binding domain
MRRLVPFASLLLVAACAEPYGPTRMSGASAPTTRAAPAPIVPQASAEVRDAQQRLRTLGFYDGAIDGLWGPETQGAVERFQRQQGLDMTARLDAATVRAMRGDAGQARLAPAAPAVAATPITVADPTDVRTLQNRLRQLGFFDRPADGVWGHSTQVALENFQKSRGMPVGQLTTTTVSALGLDPAAFPSRTAAAPSAPAVTGDAVEPRVVRNVQRRLRQLGFYDGGVDAVWGPGTQTALERFQQSRGLEANGQLNPATAAALGFDPNNLGSSAAVRR